MLSLTHLTEAATELLNTADKRASERIGVVRTPAVDDEAGPGDSNEIAVTLSEAAAALLDADEREHLVGSGALRVEDDGAPPSTPAAGVPAAADADADAGGLLQQQLQQRRLRTAEWSALQQELQILSMHGRKLHARLLACAE